VAAGGGKRARRGGRTRWEYGGCAGRRGRRPAGWSGLCWGWPACPAMGLLGPGVQVMPVMRCQAQEDAADCLAGAVGGHLEVSVRWLAEPGVGSAADNTERE
jgi:hypothetical protein